MCTQGRVAHMQVRIMSKVLCSTCRPAQGSITASCMFVIPAVPYPWSLADLLNREHRAESHIYLPSSAWVTVPTSCTFPSHLPYFCVTEHTFSSGELSKWNKQSHSTEKDSASHFDETGCRQYQPSTLQPLAIDFWLLGGPRVVRSSVLVGTVGWCGSTPGMQSCAMCDEKDLRTV